MISPQQRFTRGMNASRRPTGIILGTIVAILAFAIMSVASGFIPLVFPAIVAQHAMLVHTFAFAIIWLVVWVWVRAKEARPFASLGFHRPRLVPLVRGAVIGLGLILVIVGIGVGSGHLQFLDSPTGPAYWPATGWVLLALLAFIVQGGAEELLARGYLVQVWYRRTGLVGAVIVSTVFFTLLHSTNTGFGVLPVVGLVLVSIALVFWALAEGGLWGVLAFHAVWNWAQGSLLGIAVSGTPAPNSLFAVVETEAANPLVSGGAYGLEGSLITMIALAVLAAGAVLGFIRTRARERDSSSLPG